ncbi:MAG: response regulator transcription factor [Ferruginibacter sp.]|nr:response regulator transcription factor [Ferruginibacter sp.]
MKRFLLIDDHTVVRSGIKVLLTDIYKDVDIKEAQNGESALLFLQNDTFDLVTLDIQMPNTDTYALMELIKRKYPLIKVLVFSMSPESIYAVRFIRAGAKGFISKDAPLEDIKTAIDKVLNDKKYFSENLLDLLAEGNGTTNNSNPFSTLSAREFEIVSMLLTGKTISVIAADLSLSLFTVGTHKGRIFNKLKVTNLLELKALSSSYDVK